MGWVGGSKMQHYVQKLGLKTKAAKPEQRA
jgi:hypothetical protein